MIPTVLNQCNFTLSIPDQIFVNEIKRCELSDQEMKSIIEKNSRNFIKIGFQNVRSLISNIDKYRLFFEKSTLSLIGIVETWLKQSNTNKSVELNGYTIVRSDRSSRTKKRGGGVALYVKKGLKFTVVARSPPGSDIDFLFLKLKTSNLVFGIVYRPPDSDISLMNDIYELISDISSTESNITLMGDFNINLLEMNSSKTRTLFDNLHSLTFKIVPSSPSCHKYGCRSSLIDFVTGNCLSNVNNCYQSGMAGVSDHDFLCFDFRVKNKKQPPEDHWYRDYNNIDWRAFTCDLSLFNFDLMYYCNNVDDKLSILNNSLLSVIESHAPLRKKIIPDPGTPWISPQIRRMIKNRSDAYECWKKDKGNEVKWNNFARLRNITNREVNFSKREFFASQLNINLPANKLWHNIERLGLKRTTTRAGGGDVTAMSLNNFFVSHYIPHTFTEIPSDDDLVTNFSFHGITSDEVLTEISSASCDSVGNDEIPLKILKMSLAITLPYITELFNFCITTSTFPSMWKIARVVPIGKIDNPACESDYRPISILSSLSKILEKILSKQLNEYLNMHDLLCHFQSGYRKNCSTTTALIKIDSDIRKALDKKMLTVLVLLDFSKAFDSINHQLLCRKLKRCFMLHESAVGLILSYLSNRSQYVDFNGLRSDVVGVESGVPQGSILGPLLFSMFINDLPNRMNYCQIHLYADDCQVYLSGKLNDLANIVYKINLDLKNIVEWSNANGLILNARKTQAIVFRTKHMNVEEAPLIKIGNESINYSEVIKNLGILMDSQLNWKAQTNAVCQKVYYALHTLVALKHYTPQQIRLKLARSLIIPLFEYGDVFYTTSTNENFRKLQLAFNSVTRFVYGLKRFDHISAFSKSILNCGFREYLDFRTCTMTHKILNNPPKYLENFFTITSLPRTLNFLLPRCETKILRDSFEHRAIRLWNNLPRTIKGLYSFSRYKKECKLHFSN